MRIVGTLAHENEAQRLKFYFASQGIDSRFEVSFDPMTGLMAYQVWVHEEDRLQEAQKIFQEFEKNPLSSRFDAPIPEPEEAPPPLIDEEKPPIHQFQTHLTHLLIALCSLFFFLNTLQEISLSKEDRSKNQFVMTPLQALFMFDLPPAFEEVGSALGAPNQTPYWKGIYSWAVSKIKEESNTVNEGPLFQKIRQGEIWRLFSPCLLHQDLLHILFNMLWLWYLGKPIEQRIGPFRTLLLTLITGIGANVVQYLMSGPFFIGYSGIVTALAGFIWMREHIAPWEGYPLNRATLFFLLFFIGAIFLLQVGAFFIQVFTHYNFSPNIANSAHIAGALFGALLGRMSFFAQRMKP